MDANKILSSNLLDLVFDGRNKEYGAYELRKQYNKRLTIALSSTALGLLLIFLTSFLISAVNDKSKGQVQVQELKLEDIVQEEKNEPPPPPPPKPPEPPKVEMAKFTPPKVVKDEEVKEEEKPPEVEKLEDTKIGTSNQEGIKDEGIVAPPVDQGGVVEAPKSDDEDKVFQKVEIDAEFPGGTQAWFKYVTREIERNIDELQDDGKSGTVVVLFIVDKEGAVSDVRAMSCSEAGVANCLSAGSKLAEVAVNAIRKGPKWKPAVQNGRNVKAYRRQPVTFRLEEE
ncbi:MAG: energy transducer TonB [Chitinophagaceae bacterium]|jgi:protein TonB|nr:energy transducer TonB [Chitinophagaceae bacterium]